MLIFSLLCFVFDHIDHRNIRRFYHYTNGCDHDRIRNILRSYYQYTVEQTN
jgi:hypothetical protein